MSQNVEDIKPSYPLFGEPEYKESLAGKRACFEEAVPDAKIDEVFQWTTSEEYKEKNFGYEPLATKASAVKILCLVVSVKLTGLGFERTIGQTGHRICAVARPFMFQGGATFKKGVSVG